MDKYTIFVQTVGSMPRLYFNSGVTGDEKTKDAAVERFRNSGIATAIAIFKGDLSHRLTVTEQEVLRSAIK